MNDQYQKLFHEAVVAQSNGFFGKRKGISKLLPTKKQEQRDLFLFAAQQFADKPSSAGKAVLDCLATLVLHAAMP